MKASRSFETSGITHPATRRHNPENTGIFELLFIIFHHLLIYYMKLH